VGPLASKPQWQRVQGYLTAADGRLLTGGPGRLEGHDKGYGRELGRYGLDEFVEIKSIQLG
jgi:hypothetical protein